MNEKPFFSPSLMCMDLLDIKNQVNILNSRADFYHVDIMDGHFVKNITLSPDFVKVLSTISTIPIDCHLMVTSPDDYIESLAKAGAGYICPHAETINTDAFRIINKIRSLGCKVGVVLNPATPLSYIQHYIHLVDKITIMSVDPGFAGQPFIREMLDKIREAKRLKQENGYHYLIEIDGSCNEKTYAELYNAGVEVFILGTSGLFNLDADLEKAWDKMREIFRTQTGQ
ncbi:D-allulose 6-phosphate 3-epimerase [Acetanaerobacterium elongatum]|uniref:Putative D-allulose-6-phosphate 3-epimerase n=1 Tax=Acetanaerobacterium elongatum TaxID=258515 RepID=A0A1H0GZN2_9FIRM|nr:D-allulose 6-phosphate 3-epimerase [Acetanaerobacterium elongatum]SDO12272.1 D-allulose-6-phosphate 3-epimerase [Acetanaerobacterium elongatum]